MPEPENVWTRFQRRLTRRIDELEDELRRGQRTYEDQERVIQDLQLLVRPAHARALPRRHPHHPTVQ